MNEGEINIVWPTDVVLATHVFMGYIDISSAGLRALMFIRKIWSEQSSQQFVENYSGKIKLGGQNISKAWKDCSRCTEPESSLEICTFFDKERVPVVSFLFLNAILPAEIVTGVAIDLAQGLISRKVRKPYID